MAENIIVKAGRLSRSTKSKIFIVDDQPIVRQGMSQLINQESDLVLCGEAGDIMHALPSINKCGPDLVVADITLGPTCRLNHIEELCHQNPHLLVLILSMQDEALYAERCLRAGAKGYIMKQEPPDMLLLAIRKILNG